MPNFESYCRCPGCGECGGAVAAKKYKRKLAELRGKGMVPVPEAAADLLKELADEPCSYGDGCPPFAGTRHGDCLHCKAKRALAAAKEGKA